MRAGILRILLISRAGGTPLPMAGRLTQLAKIIFRDLYNRPSAVASICGLPSPLKKTSFGGCLHRDTGNTDKKEAPLGLLQGALRKGAATYSPGLPVPSAWRGLTSLFGMGRGGTPAL